MPDIGNSLREARIRRGLTIKDVEDATKIRSKYLEALEENDYEVLPGPTYVKAFLRTYATFLKLDPDALLQGYRHAPEARREESGLVPTEAVQRSRSRTATERKKQRTRRRNQRGYAIVGVLAVVAVFLLAWFGSGRGGGDTTSLDGSSFSSVTTAQIGGQSTTTAEVEAGSTTSTSAPVSSNKNVTLVINVTEGSCWLVVREDNENGAELYAGTLSAGGQKTFDGAKRYWLNVGEPGALALSVNGTPHTLDAEGDTFIFVVTEAGIERGQ